MLKKLVIVAMLAMPLTGCGYMQGYDQYMDNNQRTYERNQKVLDAKNEVTIANLQVQAAQAQAQVNIAIAKGKAEAQDIQTRSLKPLFVQQELVDAIANGKVQTMVLPANAMLPLNLQQAVEAQH